jgi:CheY-like chemotaxis protein
MGSQFRRARLAFHPRSGPWDTGGEPVALMDRPAVAGAGGGGEPGAMSGAETDPHPIAGPIERKHDPFSGTVAGAPGPAAPEAEAPAPLRLVIVDDSQVFLETLRRILETLPGIEVVGLATDGRGALELVAKLHPDVVLMDLTMPEMDGLQASRRLATRPGKPIIVMMSIHDLPNYRKASLTAGADAFISKSDLLHQFEPMIRDLLNPSRPEGPWPS